MKQQPEYYEIPTHTISPLHPAFAVYAAVPHRWLICPVFCTPVSNTPSTKSAINFTTHFLVRYLQFSDSGNLFSAHIVIVIDLGVVLLA